MDAKQLAKRQKILAKIQEFTLMDDDFMTVFFDNDIPRTEYVLRIIMENDTLSVKSVKTQYGIKNLKGRSVRLDVRAEDAGGKVYDIEIQNADSGAGARRARYNSALMDADATVPKMDTEKLPETFVIFITANEYASLGTDAKSALDTYRTLGGAVFVTKGNDGFADVQEAAAALKPIDEACDILSGDIQMNYGSDSALLGDLQRIPIEAKATIPVKTLLLVLALFACIIVPVAVLRSVKRNTRIRLLAILPGAAAVFALAVAISVYAFFGTTPTVRLQSVTVLDQTTKKAITLGQFGVFTPVSLDGQIAFPSDTSFARRHVRAQNDDDELVTVDSADEQRLVDGWVKPLVSAFFDFSRVCERPERLDFRVSPNGDVSVVNLLGAKVKSGHANVGGALWAFHDVEPGVITLRRTPSAWDNKQLNFRKSPRK